MSTLAHHPKNDLVRPISGGLVIVLVAWNIAGWVLTSDMSLGEKLLLVAMTLFFEFLGFNASAQMARAAEAGKPRQRNFWIATLLMCSGWSIFSAHHAFGVIAAPEVEWGWSFEAIFEALKSSFGIVVLTIAAVVVPLLPWAIETTERAANAKADAEEAERDAKMRAEAKVAERKQDEEKSPAPETTPVRPASAKSAQTVANALRKAPQRSREPRAATAQETIAKRAPPLTESDVAAAIAALRGAGNVISITAVAKAHAARTGVETPASRVERSPGYHLIKAAKAA